MEYLRVDVDDTMPRAVPLQSLEASAFHKQNVSNINIEGKQKVISR